jgi:hypothetical protein
MGNFGPAMAPGKKPEKWVSQVEKTRFFMVHTSKIVLKRFLS